MPDDLDDLLTPEHAKAFVLRHLKPADSATERAVEALRIELGQRRNEGNRRALCGFLWACQLLSNCRSDLLGSQLIKTVPYIGEARGLRHYMIYNTKYNH